MLEFLTSTLYHISNALLVPVIIALLAMLLWSTLLLGGFVREWYDRRKVKPFLDSVVATARRGTPSSSVWRDVATAPSGLPKRFVQFVDGEYHDPKILEQALTHLENDIASSLARHSFITRLSPILGLMGTLIPLGPALSGLANGNMQALSGNLIVAFTATVVGLLVSGVAYGMGLARRVWYAPTHQPRVHRRNHGACCVRRKGRGDPDETPSPARRRAWDDVIEDDPGASLLNLFDVWIAFAVALLLAMVSYMKLPEMMNAQTSFTLVANPGTPNMEIIRKDGRKSNASAPPPSNSPARANVSAPPTVSVAARSFTSPIPPALPPQPQRK